MKKNSLELQELINVYGYPDALIDNHNDTNMGYAIWGFEDIFQYNAQDQTTSNPLDILQTYIDKWSDNKNEISCIGFISYDIKNTIYPHIKFKPIKSNFPILWFGKPKLIKPYFINSKIQHQRIKGLSLRKDILQISKYKNIIKKIKSELKQGNTYQINFTMEKKFKISNDELNTYFDIREKAKPAFGYYLNTKNFKILSFSPENFFSIKGNTIKTHPMKGTIARSKNLKKDIKLKNELKNSDKDKAEHLMIVDLLRNDIGKICKYGSIDVEDLFKVRSYETVHQMVSCIFGELKNNIRHNDIFKALCPGGSITGAPKESSMKIIDCLEDYNRGIYTGSIGYIKSNGDANFNMAIRTMLINHKEAKYSVGGGIVWDSKSEEEWEEAQLKSKILDNFIK